MAVILRGQEPDGSRALPLRCADPTKKGRLHFEHYEPELENAADAGECFGGYSSWTWPNAKAQGI